MRRFKTLTTETIALDILGVKHLVFPHQYNKSNLLQGNMEVRLGDGNTILVPGDTEVEVLH